MVANETERLVRQAANRLTWCARPAGHFCGEHRIVLPIAMFAFGPVPL